MNLEHDLPRTETGIYKPWIPLFDVDGVITSPNTKKPNLLLLNYLQKRLLEKAPVGLASTRDFAWVETNVIDPIRSQLLNSSLDNLFVSTEKSAVTTTFRDGEMKKVYDESLRVPQSVGDKLRSRIEDNRYDGIFYYPKETLFTAEIYGEDYSVALDEQKRQLSELYELVREDLHPFGTRFKADKNVIAIDIYSALGNKTISARKFIAFLEDKGINPRSHRFITVGDGITDLEMADGIKESDLDVDFGWVGKDPLQDPRGHKVIQPNNGEIYDLGTVAILRQIGELS